MCSGEIKNVLLAIIISAAGLSVSSVTYAAPSCSSLLTKAEDQSTELNPFEIIQEEIDQAKTPREVNTLTYELVALGNKFFDHVIDSVVDLERNPPATQEEAQEKSNQIYGIIDALQEAFKIPSFVMNSAINNRLSLEHTEAVEIANAQGSRIAIGFERNESSEDFHADQSIKQQIGFDTRSSTQKEQNPEQLTLGRITEQLNTESEVAENSPKNSIGFITSKERASAETTNRPLDQIGFIRSEDFFDNVNTLEIVINVQTGEFRILNSKMKNPVGF